MYVFEGKDSIIYGDVIQIIIIAEINENLEGKK